MFKDSDTKKAKRKLEIKELAQIATEKINENKFLLETLSLYQTQINNIKKILDKKSKLINSMNEQTTNITTNTNANDVKDNNNEQNINFNFTIKNDFLSLYHELKNSVDNLKETNKKLLQKYDNNYNAIFDESSLTKLDLNKNRIDIFILDYELKQKNDIIRKLNENLNNSRKHSIFRELRRESEINRNRGTNYLNNDNLYLQRDLQFECKHYNKCINRVKKKEKNCEKFKKAEKYFENIIKYYKDNKQDKKENKNNNKIFNNKKNDVKTSNFFSFGKKKTSLNNKRKNSNKKINDYNSITINELGKKYQFEDEDSPNLNQENENNHNDMTYLPNNNQINEFFSTDNLTMSGHIKYQEIQKNKEQEKNTELKQKLNFLTFDELFDLDNEEGEKEVIIQEELHSDDEVVFEKKIKNKNRVNTKYLDDIKKVVPRLYLNQIEFNKKKVMNEADLYSLQRREYNKQNVDENIKTMKKKIKTMKKRIEINKEKLIALNNFITKANEQYNAIKTVKVLSSMKDYNISFMKKEFYNYRTNKEGNTNTIDEVDEKNFATQANKEVDFDEGDSYDEDAKYDLDEQDDIDDYSDKMRKKKGKIEKENNKNNYLVTETDYNENKKNKIAKKYVEHTDNNRAKSK
jgi:hypothetical protein